MEKKLQKTYLTEIIRQKFVTSSLSNLVNNLS